MTTTYTLTISTTFAFIVGGIALLCLVIKLCRYHLPSNKIKVLESLLDETDTFFKKAVEDGLLHEPDFIHATEKHLTVLKDRTRDLRSRVYSATTPAKDYAEFFRGTSRGIGKACQSLKKLRADVITSSDEGRRSLMEMNSVPHSSPPSLPPNRANPETAAVNEIIRPPLCPAALSVAGSSVDTQSIATSSSNPFNDPMQEEDRRRLMEMNSAPQPSPPVQPINPWTQTENRPTPPPVSETIPCSCLPSIPVAVASSDDTQLESIANSASGSNPFNDPTRTDSNVQTTDAQDRASSVYTSTNLERTA